MTTKFYTNVAVSGNNILLRGYDDGKRVAEKIPYSPYLFVDDRSGNVENKYRTITGRPAARMDFDTIKEARKFVADYKDVSGMSVYGMTQFQYAYIYDTYKGMIDYDPSHVSVVSIDIEVDILNSTGFPDIQEAANEVTLITISRNGFRSVFGCGDYEIHGPNIKYYKCKDEYALLQSFLDVWNSVEYSPDIVTGWNIEFFDIPYLVNRIIKVLGEFGAKKLSPWNYLTTTMIENRGQQNQVYTPVGVAVLDYIHLYKKFAFKQQESYSLDHIAQEELGEKKLDTTPYGGLAGLQRNHWQKYVEYNIRDVDLVDKLDEKLKLIELVMSIAYDAKINYNDAFTTVRAWDVIIHNYLLDRCKVIPQLKVKDNSYGIMGGYVRDVQTGMHKWVVSFDLNSLYPHIIMQYNMSAETMRGRYPGSISGDKLLEGMLNDPHNREILESNNYSVTANGCLFDQSEVGFLPALMERMYDDRKEFQGKMKALKKQYEALSDKTTPEAAALSKEVARWHNAQMAKKIQLNAAYGAHANAYFRWFDPDFAEGITSSGQLTTRWIERKLNDYLNKTLKTQDVDYILACDTDSVYLTLDALVAKVIPEQYQHDTQRIVKFIDKLCVETFEPFIESCFEELRAYMNAGRQKMKMKRECIADKGIWTAKKRYILNVWNQEGTAYEKPKLKMMGIEAIRTSTPAVCRTAIKDALSVIMNKDETALQDYVMDFRMKFSDMDFESVAFPRGVKDLEKYADAATVFKKGCPIAVKGALVYNHLLKQTKLDKVYEPISSGSKVKFSYLVEPNPAHCKVISASGNMPKELGLDKYIDHNEQFEKSFLEPIRTITEAIGWRCEKKATLEDFFM